MNKIKLAGIYGSILLFIGAISPLAVINYKSITLFPIWNNLFSDNFIFQWWDISFFAITMSILIILSIFFSLKKLKAGLIITALLSMFVSIIVFATILKVQFTSSSYANIDFSLSWGWIPFVAGCVLILIDGTKKTITYSS